MKRLIAVLIVLGGAYHGAQFYQNYLTPQEEDFALEADVTEVHESIRASNIGIEIRVSSTGFLTYDLYTAKGSGVVFNEDDDYYYAITNYHVIYHDEVGIVTYQIFLSDNAAPITAELYAFEEDLDLAIMRFAKSEFDIPLIDIYTRLHTKFDANETVFIVGNPNEEEGNVSIGIFEQMAAFDELDFLVIHYSGQFYKGQSGGALTDVNGNLIGINTWGNPETNNEGLAIPLFQIHQFLQGYDILPVYEIDLD